MNRERKQNPKKLYYAFTILMLTFTLVFGQSFLSIGNAQPRTKIKVGYFPFAGYHEINSDGQRTGYGYDILQEMLVYGNWEYEYIGFEDKLSWDDAQEMLTTGKIDLLTSATKNVARLSLYDYSSVPIGTSSTILTVKAGTNRFDVDDYSAWNGIRVGMLANNSRNQSFDNYAKAHNFTYTKYEYDTPESLQDALNTGAVEMIVTSNLLRLYNVNQVDKFDEKPFYVIVKKGNEALLKQVNAALEEMLRVDNTFANKLYSKYYESQASGIITFTKSEQAFINKCREERRVFTAIINPDRKPLAYYTGEEVSGLLVDISKTIFKRTGLNVRFKVVKSRDEYLAAIKNHEADIIADYSGTKASAEENYYVGTDVYYTGGISKLYRKESVGEGNVCALTKSSTSNILVEDQKDVKYIYFDSNEECQEAVKNGTADFTYSYTRLLQEIVFNDPTNSLIFVTVPEVDVRIRMAVNLQDDYRLSAILNKGVTSISERDVSLLSENYTYYDRKDRSLKSIMYDQPLLFVGMVALLLLAIFAAVFAYVGKKRSEKESLLNVELKKASEVKSAFLSRVSHDMRTPLNAIISLNGFLLEDENNPDKRGDLEKIKVSGEHLLDLVNDMLDVGRIENGRLELHPSVYDGEEVLNRAINLMKPAMEEKQIHFEENRNDAPMGLFYMDRARFLQIFLNVCSNAVKFTPNNGTIKLDMHKISDDSKHFMVKFTITDTGIGMSKEFAQHIFEPFAQASSSKKDTNKGTGLGMTIAREIVHQMGGEMEVESELGKGTSISFTINIQRATEAQIEEAKERNKTVKTEHDAINGKHILLCEDHPVNAEITKRFLEKKGATVTWAQNGAEGYDFFMHAPSDEFALVLMDIRMPEMDGLETAQAIRTSSHPRAKTIPIIAMSANVSEEDVEKSKEAGMNYHLGKPINPVAFYQTLNRYLQ